MGLKDDVENKVKEKITLSKREDAFFKLQERIKTEGEGAISSEYLMNLLEGYLDWEDLQNAGISSAKLEEAMAEYGVPVRQPVHQFIRR